MLLRVQFIAGIVCGCMVAWVLGKIYKFINLRRSFKANLINQDLDKLANQQENKQDPQNTPKNIGCQTIEINENKNNQNQVLPHTVQRLKQIKSQFEKNFIHQKFFLLSLPFKPYSIITPYLNMFSNLGGVSCWIIDRSNRNQLNNGNQNINIAENSFVETEDGSVLQDDDAQIVDFKAIAHKSLLEIQKKEWLSGNGNQRYKQIGHQIYNSVRYYYERYSLSVIITEKDQINNRWTAVWSDKANYFSDMNFTMKNRVILAEQEHINEYSLKNSGPIKKQIVQYQRQSVQLEVLLFIN